MKPPVWRHVKPVPTIWVDYTTGRGVTDDGRTVRPKVGERRKNPNLADLLDTAQLLGAQRIMLTGKVPDPVPGKRHWLIAKTPGWIAGRHLLRQPQVGRFEHELTGLKVEVRRAGEWFSDDALTPAQAAEAWAFTERCLQEGAHRDARLLLTPARTGANLWALSHERSGGFDVPLVDPDLADELHFTSGQHRIEHLVAGGSRCTCGDCLPTITPENEHERRPFAYVDGRFMYASLLRQRGIGPGRRITRAEAADLMHSRDGIYARARYKVRVTVPDGWHHVGLLARKHENVADGWHYPNRPGASWETWADSVELHLAHTRGWRIEPIEGVLFETGRPLDTWGEQLIRARALTETLPGIEREVRRAAARALRSVLIQTIGAFATRGRTQQRVVWHPREVPAEAASTMTRYGDAYVFHEPAPDSWLTPFYRPEIAAQVWAFGRTRVLDSPTGTRGVRGGALSLDPATVAAINGDALYATQVPAWSLPTDRGGGDDGKVGRLRLQGVLPSAPLPSTRDIRDSLREQAETAGYPDDLRAE